MKKGTLLFMTAVTAAVIGLGGVGAAAQAQVDYAWFGDGSATTFTIRTAAELRGLANIVGNRNPDGSTITGAPAKTDFAGKTINLAADIALTGTFNPIGAGVGTGTIANPGGSEFNGTFDGNGHTISGLRPTGYTVETTTSWPIGLFSIIGSNGIVRNLSVSVTSPPTSRAGAIGGIAGINYGTITNCFNTGTFSTASVTVWNGIPSTGGIVGRNFGTVSNCHNTGNITGGTVGGIVGRNVSNTIEGFIGRITDSYNTGEIIGTNIGSRSGDIGGIAGENASQINRVYNTGNVRITGSAESVVGGVVGNSTSGSISNCYNTGNVSNTFDATPHVGGITAFLGSVSNCYNTGNVSANSTSSYIGGIASNILFGSDQITSSVSLGLRVQGANAVGRVVGRRAVNTPNSLSNNRARSDMLIGTSSVSIPTANRTADGINGADVSLGTPLSTVFSGWSTTVWDIPAANLVVNGALPTLRAIPQESPPLLPGSGFFTVTYNRNGGAEENVPVDATQYFGGSTVTVLDAGELARTGHTFTGWNTAANGSGTSYAAGATFAITANVTLHAQWTPNAYTVTYDGNGSTDGTIPAEQTGNFNTTVNVRARGTLAKDGYAFVNWNTAADGSGTTFAANASFTIPAENTTLYAQWTPLYTVSYDGNGNTGGTVPANQTGVFNTSISLSGGAALSRTGYRFVNWNTAADGSGTSYTASASFIIPAENTTLYAQWIARHTVTYNGNGNTSGTIPTSRTVDDDSTITVASRGTLVRTHYIFMGWNTAADGSGTAYAAGASFAVTASVTLYAQWEEDSNVYALTYNGNGHTEGTVPEQQRYDGGTTVTVANAIAAGLRREGYTFTGWNTAADGSGTPRAAGATFVITEPVTLFAQWAQIIISVTNITDVPTETETAVPLSLTGTVIPSNATNRTIVWSIENAGNTGAVIASGDRLLVTDAGSVTIKATIANGVSVGEDYEQLFTINATVSIQEPGRDIPISNGNIPNSNIPDSNEVAVVVPIEGQSTTITAGPNPVNRQSDGITFYISGMTVESGTLIIYDATGNVVRRIEISENVTTWDLKDARGRTISDGTYLVRGRIIGVNGKRERVSVVVGVR